MGRREFPRQSSTQTYNKQVKLYRNNNTQVKKIKFVRVTNKIWESHPENVLQCLHGALTAVVVTLTGNKPEKIVYISVLYRHD